MEIRELTEADAETMRELRLRSLVEDPDSFLTSYEEDLARPVEVFAERLRATRHEPASAVLGAFRGDRLIGMLGYNRGSRIKERHKVTIWGIFVELEARGQGIGRALLTSALERLRRVEGVEQVQLAVTTRATAARNLYHSAGFEEYGLEVHAMKDSNGRYIDVEMLVLRLD